MHQAMLENWPRMHTESLFRRSIQELTFDEGFHVCSTSCWADAYLREHRLLPADDAKLGHCPLLILLYTPTQRVVSIRDRRRKQKDSSSIKANLSPTLTLGNKPMLICSTAMLSPTILSAFATEAGSVLGRVCEQNVCRNEYRSVTSPRQNSRPPEEYVSRERSPEEETEALGSLYSNKREGTPLILKGNPLPVCFGGHKGCRPHLDGPAPLLGAAVLALVKSGAAQILSLAKHTNGRLQPENCKVRKSTNTS